MRITRLYIDQDLSAGARLSLDGQQAHYLSKVLRLKANSPLIVFNGKGGEYEAQISHVDKRSLELDIGKHLLTDPESPLKTVLGLGLSRGERMDYAIQKSTELGVNVIVPLLTEFCEVKLQGERLQKKMQHWQQIVISACEQSGRTRLPDLLSPQALISWCENQHSPVKLIFDPGLAGKLNSQSRPDEVALLIGPEGGFSPAELAVATKYNFQPIQLGPRVLRTETAPLAALTSLQVLWGDFSF